ncbi:DsbA family protein [Pikeienuella sp. HZG-20]|uniref:DsbA family protein n=1 Tax=Paludibacillus litoralis TaxID=3133267 RepID=UPI0030EBF719
MTRLIVATFFALSALSVMAPAGAAEFSDAEQAAINDQIRAYLLENPEVIVEAMQVLEQRQREQANSADREKIAAARSELFDDGFSGVAGNPNGDVTVIEFFDYECPYCKRAHESLKSLLEADDGVRVILKEFPILGPRSTFASRAAMAARRQGDDLYWAYSDAMLSHRGALDERAVFTIAGETGLDVDRLKADMEDPGIAENIRATYALARRLEINGTPGFIIGDQVVRGFVPYDRLREMVEEARRPG